VIAISTAGRRAHRPCWADKRKLSPIAFRPDWTREGKGDRILRPRAALGGRSGRRLGVVEKAHHQARHEFLLLRVAFGDEKGKRDEAPVVEARAAIRQEKDQAVRALKSSSELLQEHPLARDRAEAEVAVAKAQIVEALAGLAKTAETEARLAKLQQDSLMDKEELQKARTALLAVKRQNEQLLDRIEPAVSNARPIR
jgi:hypothetical protein